MCVLLELPPSVLVPVLTEWIDMEDLCYLDTAVCSSSTVKGMVACRQSFLSLIREPYFVLNNPRNDNCTSKSVGWISRRRLKLRYLRIDDSESSYQLIKTQSSLTQLTLKECRDNNNQAFDAMLPWCSGLTSLDVASCGKIFTENSIKLIAQHCPNLVHFAPPTSIRNDMLIHFISLFPAIRGLSLENCRDISNESVNHTARNCPQITHLNLNKCSNVTNSSLVLLVAKCVNLEELQLCVLYEMTDEVLLELSKHCSRLITLRLSGCQEITDSGLCAVVRSANKLRNLSISKCIQLTDVSVREIAKNCTKLERLDMNQCYDVTTESVMELNRSCPLLTHLGCSATRATPEALKLPPKDTQFVLFYVAYRDIWTWGDEDKLEYSYALNPSISRRHMSNAMYTSRNAVSLYFISSACTVCCDSLLKLSLYGQHQLTDNMMLSILLTCPNITELHLIDNEELTGNVVRHIADNRDTRINKLHVSEMHELFDSDIAYLTETLSDQLIALSVDNCPRLTEKSIVNIAERCTMLTELSIQGMRFLPDGPVRKVLRNCEHLRKLDISHCIKLTDAVVNEAIWCGKRVKQLNTEGCPKITLSINDNI